MAAKRCGTVEAAACTIGCWLGTRSKLDLLWPNFQLAMKVESMLYRDMDRAQLDAAYNNTAHVPERGAIIADWAARSAAMRNKRANSSRRRFTAAVRASGSIYCSLTILRRQLSAFLHGGYWQMHNKETFAFFAEGLLPLRNQSRRRRIQHWRLRGSLAASLPRYAARGAMAHLKPR